MIGQDRTENAIELQRVIDDTLPLLQAVEPQDLAFTLGAVADALRGRGDDAWARTWRPPASTSRRSTPCCRSCRPTSPPRRLRRHLRRRGRRPARRPRQPGRHQHDDRRPGGAAAPHVHGRGELGERAGRVPRDQRANLISLAETSGRCSACSPSTRRVYPCLLEGLTRSVPRIGESFGGRRRPGAEPQHRGQLPAAEPLRARRPAGLPRPVRARLQGAGRHRRGDRGRAAGEYYCPHPRTTASTRRTARAATGTPLCFGARPDDGGDPRRRARALGGNALPSAWPAPPRSWTSCAASSATRPARKPGTSPTSSASTPGAPAAGSR